MLSAPRALLAALMLAASAMLLPASAFAHATVWPKASTTGGHERYVLRVPNEKNVATTKVEITFPAGLRVTAFSDVPGWQLAVQTDSAGRVTGAIWTGTLEPKRFVEFPFVAANPKEATRLVWPAFQTYSDGERVAWTGPTGDKRPASATEISAPAVAATAMSGSSSSPALYMAGGALLLSLVSLGLSLRRPEPVRA